MAGQGPGEIRDPEVWGLACGWLTGEVSRQCAPESIQHEQELHSSVRKVTLAGLGYWPLRCWHDGLWMEWLWWEGWSSTAQAVTS